MVGDSKKHREWQEKALRKILDETGGRIVEEGDDQAKVSSTELIPLFEKSVVHKRELVEKKLIVNDRLAALMGTLSLRGGGGVIYFENFCLFDVCDPKNAARTYRISSGDFLSGIFREFWRSFRSLLIKSCTYRDAWHWQAKFERASDPNNVASDEYF